MNLLRALGFASLACAALILPAKALGSSSTEAPAEADALRAIVEEWHRTRPYSRALLASPVLAEQVEWWAAGDRARLPWAGSWQGKVGIEEFFRRLAQEMTYEQFETTQILASGGEVVALIRASGRAKRSGREFRSDIVRVYSFRRGQLVRVRSFYDTSEYERALAAEDGAPSAPSAAGP